MIGTLDRRVTFYNPTKVKEDTGGHVKLWAQWFECWGSWNQNNGRQSDAGFQDNLYTQASIRVRYNELIGERLNKDTVAVIRTLQYNVVDFRRDHRLEYVEIDLIAKSTGAGATLIPTNDLLVQSRIHTITEAQDTLNSIVIPWLVGKTIITCISGRAIPFEIITSGTPDQTEGLFVSATGTFSVPEDAPFVTGEEFEFIFR